MSYRQEGVQDQRDLPGTVLSVREALALAFGSDPADPLNEREVDATIRRINAENTRREDAREEWENAEAELLGATLAPGSFYDVTENVGSFRRHAGRERTARFCEYVRRKGYGGEADRITYHFRRWGAATAKKVDLSAWGGARSTSESWTEAGIVRLTPVEATGALRENVRLSRLGGEERGAEVKRLVEARDTQPVTAEREA